MKLNKRLITGLIGGVLVLVVAGVLISSAAKKRAAQAEVAAKIALQNSPRSVKTERVKVLATKKGRSYPGIVKAADESALSFRVGGPLVQVKVTQGEPVKKGALLMQIDPRDFEDRIQSLEAQLAGAAALQNKAQQDYTRISKLFKEKVLPPSTFDSATSAQDAATASVKTLNAQLQIAHHALEDTSLRAPYDGTVSEQLVENHEMIRSGQVVLRFHSIQALEVTVSVPENEIVGFSLNEDMVAKVSFPAVPEKGFDARLQEWSSSADPLTRTYGVTFEFFAPTGFRILPGMSATVSWHTSPRESSAVTVPVSALSSRADGSSFVWVYGKSGNCAEPRHVTVGKLTGASRVIITDGLVEGERVVVSGSRLIHENLPLKTAAIR